MSEADAGSQPDLDLIWNQVTETMKQKVVMPALWRAMEGGCPIALVADTFVIGYDVAKAYDSHLLMDSRFKNIIEQSLTSSVGTPTVVRVIQGTTVEEWRQIQEEDREKERLLAIREKKEVAAAGPETGWEALSERLIRRLMTLSLRQLPSVQAEFLAEAVQEIAAAYPNLMSGNRPDDAQQRTYSRVLDRISDRIGVPATTLGYLVLEHMRKGPEKGG